MASEEAGAALTLGQERVAHLGDTRARRMEELMSLTIEHDALLDEQLSLGNTRGAAERKKLIMERISEINERIDQHDPVISVELIGISFDLGMFVFGC